MKRITRTIRWDKEFRAAMLALDEQTGAAKPLPISVSGLSDGARDAFLAECLGRADAQGAQAVFVHDEAEAVAVTAMLQREGIAALRFPQRDFVFLNISSSHDTERERLSVLCRLLTGERVTVVTTPYAALQRTIPPLLSTAISTP